MSTIRGLHLAAFAVLALGLASACSGGSHAKPTPSATASPAETPSLTAIAAATQSPSPTPVDYPEPTSIALTYGGPVDFPAGLLMYAYDASWEGPTGAIRRYYRSPDGVFHAEPLLESIWNSEDQSKMRAIVSASIGRGANDIAVTLCHGTCYGGWQPVTVARSSDGGITWNDVAERPEGGWVAAISGDQVWFTRPDWKLVSLPSGKPVHVPGYGSGSRLLSTPGFGSGSLLWAERQKVVREPSTGKTVATLPVPSRYEISWLAPLTKGAGETTMVVEFGVFGGAPNFIGLFEPRAASWRQVFRFSYADPVASFYPAGWLDDTHLLVRADFKRGLLGGSPPGMEDMYAGIPAILDIATGVVSPIREFIKAGVANKAGGPAPFAVATGTFARVTTPGDCLHVRKAAGRTSESLGCFADRVLLKVTGESTAGWLPVLAPDGRPGFASAEFLTPATR